MSATGTPFDTVLEVQAIENCSTPQLMKRFSDARTQEYRELLNLLRSPASRSGKSAMHIARLRQRFHDIVSIDSFGSPFREQVDRVIYLTRRTRRLEEAVSNLRYAC